MGNLGNGEMNEIDAIRQQFEELGQDMDEEKYLASWSAHHDWLDSMLELAQAAMIGPLVLSFGMAGFYMGCLGLDLSGLGAPSFCK